jgi:hypothetical protein
MGVERKEILKWISEWEQDLSDSAWEPVMGSCEFCKRQTNWIGKRTISFSLSCNLLVRRHGGLSFRNRSLKRYIQIDIYTHLPIVMCKTRSKTSVPELRKVVISFTVKTQGNAMASRVATDRDATCDVTETQIRNGLWAKKKRTKRSTFYEVGLISLKM